MQISSNSKWLIKMGLLFAAISISIYYSYYVLFHDTLFIYHHFIIDLAFLPLEVFLVAAIFDKLIGRREKKKHLERMHLIIGAFFHEMGSDLINLIYTRNSDSKSPDQSFNLNESWSKADFADLKLTLINTTSTMDVNTGHFVDIKNLLSPKREYLLHLMENDNLMESEHFSQLLLAVFHLIDELQLRPDLYNLKPMDFAHLVEDFKRAALLLAEQWVDYLYHLKESTPYLFSLAMRTNPLDPEARIEIE